MKCLQCGLSNSDSAAYCKNCKSYLTEPSSMEPLNTFKALILALFFTGLFYFVYPMPIIQSKYWHQLFSGHITESIFAMVLWSIFLIFFKWIQFKHQHLAYQAFRNQILHKSFSNGIYVKDVDERILEISTVLQKQKIKKFQDSIIFKRVRRTLKHLKAIPKKEEITSILNYQAEIDYNRTQNGYTLLNVFIWAIPILGFIGTVYGIGHSIGEFSDFIRSANRSDLTLQMRSALGGVTSGLSVAFSTTFIALVGVVPIMILSSSLHKREDDLLICIEEYCLEEILPNLHIRHGDEKMDQNVNEHLEKMAEFSENWRKQVKPILDSVEQNSKGLAAQVEGLQPLFQKFSDYIIKSKDILISKKNIEKK